MLRYREPSTCPSLIGAATFALAVALCATTAIIGGCGGKSSLAPDATTAGDDGGSTGTGDGGSTGTGDGGSTGTGDGGSTATAITIRAFNDGVPTSTGVTENAALVAFQDGDNGAWTALTGTNGVYHATASGGRYGVAVGCGEPTPGLTVSYQTTSETTDLAVASCFHPPADAVSIQLNVLDADGRQSNVSVGNSRSTVTGNGSVSLAVEKGKQDVLAASQVGPDGAATDPTVFRGATLDVEAATTVAIDMAAAQSLESHPLTVLDVAPAGSAETFAGIFSMFYTKFSYGLHPLFELDLPMGHAANTASEWLAPPAAMRQAGDIMYARALTRGTTAAGLGYLRVVDVETATAGPFTMTLPEVFTADPPTVDTAAIPHIAVRLPMRPATLVYVAAELDVSTTNATTSRDFDVTISPGWAHGQTMVSVASPDLSALPGWTAEMALLPDGDANWIILIDDRNKPLETPVSDGKRIIQTWLTGTVTRAASTAPATATRQLRPDLARRLARLAREH